MQFPRLKSRLGASSLECTTSVSILEADVIPFLELKKQQTNSGRLGPKVYLGFFADKRLFSVLNKDA